MNDDRMKDREDDRMKDREDDRMKDREDDRMKEEVTILGTMIFIPIVWIYQE